MSERTVNDVFQTLTEEQRNMVYKLVGYAVENRRYYLAGDGKFDNADQRRLREIYDGMNDEQRKLVNLLVEQAITDHSINGRVDVIDICV